MPQIFKATIGAIAEQCGTLSNTAAATGEGFGVEGEDLFSVADTEEIAVEGCEVHQRQNSSKGNLHR